MCICLCMAYLQKKKIRGGVYYYYTQTKRIDGKSKKVQQVYLGSPDQIFEKCASSGGADAPVKASHLEFGLPAALYQQALELGLIPLINSYATVSTPWLDVGQYLVLAAINRVCEPRSKNGIRSWYERTSLPGLFTIPLKRATGRLFWQTMDRLPTTAVPQIEQELWGTIVEQYGVVLDMLVYDTTNFFSYLAEHTPSELNKKGHNKASRHHLRQVGMSVSVIRGLGLPLIHELYDGAEHDATLFPTAISRTIDRVRALSGGHIDQLTVVFDKGNNSRENITRLSNKKVHFIGSLSPSHYPALCSIRLSRFTRIELENGSEEFVFDTRARAFDRSVRVVVTHNPRTARKQEKRFQKNLGTALAELAQVRWSTVKDPEGRIREIVSPRLPASLFAVEGEGADVRVGLDHSAVRAYRKRFGKNLIFTDREEMPVIDLVQAYRDRNEVERIFGEMNDPETVPFQPVRHWTDQKIVIHAFICLLGLLLLKLLQLKLKRKGITLSLHIIKDELSPLYLQIFVTRSGILTKIISDRSKLQSRMFDLFSLAKIASRLGAHYDSS